MKVKYVVAVFSVLKLKQAMCSCFNVPQPNFNGCMQGGTPQYGWNPGPMQQSGGMPCAQQGNIQPVIIPMQQIPSYGPSPSYGQSISSFGTPAPQKPSTKTEIVTTEVCDTTPESSFNEYPEGGSQTMVPPSVVVLPITNIPQQGGGIPQQGMGIPQQGMGMPQGQNCAMIPQQGVSIPQQGMGMPQGQNCAMIPQQGVSIPQQGMGMPQGQNCAMIPQQGMGMPQGQNCAMSVSRPTRPQILGGRQPCMMQQSFVPHSMQQGGSRCGFSGQRGSGSGCHHRGQIGGANSYQNCSSGGLSSGTGSCGNYGGSSGGSNYGPCMNYSGFGGNSSCANIASSIINSNYSPKPATSVGCGNYGSTGTGCVGNYQPVAQSSCSPTMSHMPASNLGKSGCENQAVSASFSFSGNEGSQCAGMGSTDQQVNYGGNTEECPQGNGEFADCMAGYGGSTATIGNMVEVPYVGNTNPGTIESECSSC